MTTAPGQIRVATRKSLLALTQSGLVAESLGNAELLGVDTDDEPETRSASCVPSNRRC